MGDLVRPPYISRAAANGSVQHSLVETAIGRYKPIIGLKLRA